MFREFVTVLKNQFKVVIERKGKQINPRKACWRAIAAHRRRQRSSRWHEHQGTWETFRSATSDLSVVRARFLVRSFPHLPAYTHHYILAHEKSNMPVCSRCRYARSTEKRSSRDTLTIGQLVRDWMESFQFRSPACKQDQGRDFSKR